MAQHVPRLIILAGGISSRMKIPATTRIGDELEKQAASIGDIVKAKEPPRCGSTGVGSSDYVMSRILEETIGAKMTTSWGIQAAARSPWQWKGARSYAWD